MVAIGSLEDVADELSALAESRLISGQVPGVAIGLGRGAEREVRGVGVTEATGGLPVGPRTMFQVGSVSKLFTSTLVLELVASGALDLDEPIVAWLPELRMRDRSVRDAVSLRHLMAHRAGFDGDYDLDTGRGDDALDRLLPILGQAEQRFPLGDVFSYCNLGWAITGLVAARADGRAFEASMAERVMGPLGLTRSVYFPEDVVFEEHAVGHVAGNGGPLTASWGRPRCRAPNGGVVSSADDLVTFALYHAARAAERDDEAYRGSLDAGDMADVMGLGFMVDRLDGVELVGHGGATPGFRSWLGFEPASGSAVAIVANSDAGWRLISDLLATWFGRLTGTPPPPVGGAAPGPSDVESFAGRWVTSSPVTYARSGAALVIEPDRAHGLVLSERTGAWSDRHQVPASVLSSGRIAIGSDRLRRSVADRLTGADGRAWLRWNGRLYRRGTEGGA